MLLSGKKGKLEVVDQKDDDNVFLDSTSLRRCLQEGQTREHEEGKTTNQEGTPAVAGEEKTSATLTPEDFPGESINIINKLTTHIAENIGNPDAVKEGFESTLSGHCTSCPFFNLLFSIETDEEIVHEFLETLAFNHAKDPEALLKIGECAEHLGVVFKSHLSELEIDEEFDNIYGT